MAPGFGAIAGPYLKKGEFRVNAGFSRFETDEEFRGVQHRTDLESTNRQVYEGADTLDLMAAYGLSRQISLSVSAPVILYSHWSTVLAGTRYDQNARGLGDMVFSANYWLWNCKRYPEKNISLGLGLRAPTGNSNYQVMYPNSLGQDVKLRPVFPGIQPGGGAFGLRLSIDGFQRIKHFVLFGSGVYTFSLRKQNDTFSLGATLNPAGVTATAENLRYVSAPDSYLFDLGLARAVPKVSRLSAIVHGRIAGVPVHNVLTGTSGFRQPGYFITVEPGLEISTRLASYTISAPLRVQAGTRANFLGQPVSSDFARYQLVLGVSLNPGRLYKREAAPATLSNK
jgi:hypothetical protein